MSVIIVEGVLIPDLDEPILSGWMTPMSLSNQPERSKREDCKCAPFPMNESGEDVAICRCGTLNTDESQ